MFTFDDRTNDSLRAVINSLYHSQKRVRLVYGDIKTGKDWLEECDVIGTIGRSTGTKKVPLLIHNSRSWGGGAILDGCIVKIVDVKTKRVIYQADNYITPNFEIGFMAITCQYSVSIGGKVQANFKTEKQAQNYIDFMLCKRMTK